MMDDWSAKRGANEDKGTEWLAEGVGRPGGYSETTAA